MTTDQSQPVHRRRNLAFGVAALAGVALLATGAFWYSSNDRLALPTGVDSPDGGVVVGDDAPVVVDDWFDFACPACAEASSELASTVDDLLSSGAIQVVYHPLSFVTPTGSALAANAFGCAADQGRAFEFHAAVLDAQGPVGEEFTNKQLLEIGGDVGISDPDFTECVNEQTYQEWVDNVAASGPDAGVSVTPTLFVNGEPIGGGDLDAPTLRDAVGAATPED